MKNKILKLIILAILITKATIAQDVKKDNKSDGYEAPFSKGSMSLSVASGFGVNYGYYGSYISLPAVTVAYDLGIFNHAGPGNIGVGGMVGYKRAYYKYDSYKATWSNYIIAARATYHLTLVKHSKFDPYGGIVLGVRIYDYKDSFYSDRYNPYDYKRVYAVKGIFVGAKYNFTKFIGGFVEFGYDISLVRIGFNANF